MYSSNGGDARSAGAFSLAREPSSSMPPDHPHATTWERPVLSRDKFDRADRDRYAAGKKEWSSDRSSAAPSSHRSSCVVSANGSLPGPPSKRRALGRHGGVVENGRYGVAVGRSSDSCALRSTALPVENGKAERDSCSLSGGRSPGYSNSPSTERPSKDLDVHHSREPCLSPADGRPASSPRVDSASRPYGAQSPLEPAGSWDRERSKFGWDASHRERDLRERWSKVEFHRRTSSLPKLDSARDWSLGDGELEGRLDRYGSASNRDHMFPDVLSGSKEHSRHDWRGRDRTLLSSFSSRSPACPFNNFYTRDLGAPLLVSEVSGSTASPQHSPLQSSTVHECVRDDVGHSSPKKRPRLTWGQGLAKYEKEKTEEDPVIAKKPEEAPNHDLSPKDGPANKMDHPAVSLLNSSVVSSLSSRLPPADRISSTGFVKPLETGTLELSSSGLQNSPCACRETSTTEQRSCGQDAVARDSDKLQEQLGNPVLLDAQALLATYQKNALNVSKDTLMQQVERLEVEIDLVEKELVKLENDHEHKLILVQEGETEAMAAEDRNMPANYALESLEPCIPQYERVASPVSAAHTAIQQGQTMEKAAVHCEENSSKCEAAADQDALTVCGAEVAVGSGMSESQQADVVVSGDLMDTECVAVKCEADQTSCLEKTGDFVAHILQANQGLAKHAQDSLVHLLPKNFPSGSGKLDEDVKYYCSPQEANVWKLNAESHEKKRKLLESKVAERKCFLKFTEKVLAVKYRALRESWKVELIGNSKRKEQAKAFRHCEPEHRNGSVPPSQRSSVRLHPPTCPTMPDVADDEIQVVSKLLSDPPVDYQRAYLRMPSMLVDYKDRAFHRFVTNYALVEDPIAAEQERRTMNPWSGEERKIFLDKYSLFGKSFGKIASFLEHKTAADCVQFYYQNQKSEEFEKVHRRHQLKKRRDYSRSSASYLATTTSGNSRHRDVHTARAESLTLVAAAAAAMSIPRDFSKVGRSTSKMVERARQFSAELPTASSSPSAAISPCPVNSSSFKIRDRNPNKQGLSSIVSAGKASHGELQSGVKGARTIHSRSVKGSSEDIDSQWTDGERELFTGAVAMFGKDFHSISLRVGSKSQGQCKAFFSKTRKRLGLDQLVEHHKATLQAGIGPSIDDMIQAGSPEDMKPLQNSEEVLNQVYSKPSAQGVENLQVDRSEQQVRVEGFLPQVDVALMNESSSLLEVRDVNTEPGGDNDSEHAPVKSALKSLQAGIQVTPVDDSMPLSRDACKAVPNATFDAVKEEACSSLDNGDMPMPPGVSQDSRLINESLVNGIHSCTQEASLVCVETLQFKTEPVRIKKEPLAASNIVHAVSNTASAMPMAVPVLLPGSLTAAPVVQPALVKDRSLKAPEVKTRREPTSWTQEEKDKFVDIIRKHGKDWDRLRESLPAKSLTQIKTYFQNSKAKLGLTSEGAVNGGGRGGSAKKRKADDSDSSSNAGSGGQIVPQKVGLHADEGSLKVSSAVLGATGSNMVSAEALAYATLFGRNPAQVLEDPVSAQKVFHSMGLAQNSTASGIIPMFNPAVFASPSLRPVQQSYVHTTSLKTPQQVNHQQPQTSLTPLVVVQPLQQQGTPVGIHQAHQLQQHQAVARTLQDLPIPVVQQLHKQASHQSQQSNVQVLLQQQQQQQQQVVQHLQQQVTEAVLQQPPLVQRQQQQQIQLTAQQVPHHLQQVFSHHQAQSNQQSSSQGVSQQPLGTSNQVIGQQQATGSQSKAAGQQQQQAVQFQSPLYLHSKSQALLQQQQMPQQQLQQLQLHLQQLQLHRQQQQSSHPLQQVQIQQLSKQISGNSQLQPQNFYFLHEQQQQQLALLRGVMQASGASSEIPKQCDSDLQNLSKFQQAGSEDLEPVVPQMSSQASSKSQVTSEAQARVGDVKLFGQWLLLQPTSSSQETNI